MIERWVLFSILMLAASRVCVRYCENVSPVSAAEARDAGHLLRQSSQEAKMLQNFFFGMQAHAGSPFSSGSVTGICDTLENAFIVFRIFLVLSSIFPYLINLI